MIRSMTGFGSASTDVDGTHYLVEVRSLNNKYFKAIVRLPEELQGLEAELESLLSARLTRGSVVATVRFSDASANAAGQINVNALQKYLDQLMKAPGLSNGQAHVDLSALLTLPGVVLTDTGEALLERARPFVMKLMEEACEKVLSMRQREGRTVHAELHRHLSGIGERLSFIAQRTPMVVEDYQRRLRERIELLLSGSGASVKEEEIIHEVAIYAERSDIAEEVSRLRGHIDQFSEIIDSKDKEPAGRTLDFLSQEMLREANTIASKSSDVDIARRIVEVKGAIDRIKEQAQNIE